jgi:hypothetical protein
MTAKKKPSGGYVCRPCTPISWLIRSYLIKTLVLQRYADVLLVCAGFVEEFGYGWN